MKRIIVILILLFSIKNYAQDSANKNTNHIYKTGKRWSMNGDKLSNKELKTELYKIPAAIPVYKKARTNEIIGYSFAVPMLVFTLLAKQSSDISSPSYGKNKRGFQIAGIISAGAVMYFILQAAKFKKMAIRVHNENLKTIY